MICSHIGKYEIVAHAGSGGSMADVFKAHQPRLDRFVALKLLHDFLAQRGDHLERFQREAQSIAKLHHPNIVQVHDFDLFDNRMFMVMEFIDRRSLKD
ncbi:MAG: protein kinase [Chloroflexi bacterium]|nr:protein kinase [Chloroflexota bacterium]